MQSEQSQLALPAPFQGAAQPYRCDQLLTMHAGQTCMRILNLSRPLQGWEELYLGQPSKTLKQYLLAYPHGAFTWPRRFRSSHTFRSWDCCAYIQYYFYLHIERLSRTLWRRALVSAQNRYKWLERPESLEFRAKKASRYDCGVLQLNGWAGFEV